MASNQLKTAFLDSQHAKNLGLDTLHASLIYKGPKLAKPTIGPLSPREFFAGKFHRLSSAIFWPREAGKVPFLMFFDAAIPKTVFSSDFDPIYCPKMAKNMFLGYFLIKYHQKIIDLSCRSKKCLYMIVKHFLFAKRKMFIF